MPSYHILHEKDCEQSGVVVRVGLRALDDAGEDIQEIRHRLKGTQHSFGLLAAGRIGSVEGGKERGVQGRNVLGSKRSGERRLGDQNRWTGGPLHRCWMQTAQLRLPC
jgi:hypothetical protein